MGAKNRFESDELINRLHGDKVIWIIFFLLGLFSIALVYSASSSLAFKAKTTNFPYLIRQLKFIIMGLVVLYTCYRIPIGWYRLLSVPALFLCIGLLLIIAMKGKEVNGAKRWIEVGGSQSFQPTEIAKIAVVLYLARILEISKLDTFREYVIKILIPIGLVCVLLMVGSVSTALFIGLVSFFILFIAGVKWSYLMKSAGLAVMGGVVLIIMHASFGIFPRMDTATNRIKKFFVQEEISKEMTAAEKQETADKTFQADMAKIAISSVGVLGKGPGNSTQRYVLPHAYSDYIYTIIIEEYGLVGALFVLMLYIWLLYRCVILVKNCKKVFTAVVVGGFGLLITTQALIHILVNVGIFPVTGHTLPLISSGGSSIMIVCCAFGIILSVSRTIDMATGKNADQPSVAAAEETNVEPVSGTGDNSDEIETVIEDKELREEQK